MTRLIAAYVIAAVIFVALDSLYLFTIGAKLFKATLGDVLAPTVTVAPAVLFYLVFPVGLVLFAIGPALDGRGSAALWQGALFGFFAYATYDLTNFATIRNWSIGITVPDLIWGTVLSGATSGLAAWLTRLVLGPA